MKKAFLIADSGGSKTDWCLFDHLGNKNYFTTDSYHPHLITDEWIQSKKDFWENYTHLYDLEVHFYGSGCMNSTNQNILKNAFFTWGINEVSIQSDILGAARASFGNNDGLIAILGTGSVLAEIENNAVKMISGGLGYILGDEGSGYYFGKLLIQHYLIGGFSEICSKEIADKLGNREKILESVYSPIGKKYLTELSFLFSETKNQEIKNLHDENIRLFIDAYLPNEFAKKEIYFVGSYAEHCKAQLNVILHEKGWILAGVVRKPIEQLAEYIAKSTF